ncbi:MAG: Smr/MutS family protein [Methylococcaceae bacterium]
MAKKIPSSEDSDLFRHTIGEVNKVKNDKVLFTAENKPKPYPKRHATSIDDSLADVTATDITTVGIEDILSFVAFDAPKNILKQLRQGYFSVDAEIDLHGLNSNEAKRQLLIFLHNGVKDGCRCVHIVHGKGYRSPDNYPILKNNLNLWLRQHKDVQAFCSASPKDGGSGAVFVLLYLSEKYEK